jgi:hypothetical protein
LPGPTISVERSSSARTCEAPGFAEADLSGVVMRGVNAEGVDIDDPFLCDGGSFLRVNGVDVIPFVVAELNRRFPRRAERRTEGPDGMRAAWSALKRIWPATLAFIDCPRREAGTTDCRALSGMPELRLKMRERHRYRPTTWPAPHRSIA